MKTGKYSFEIGIIALRFTEKYTSLSGTYIVGVSFLSVARFTIVHQMAPLLSRLTSAIENDIIAAI